MAQLLVMLMFTTATTAFQPMPDYNNYLDVNKNLYLGEGDDVDISKTFLLPPLEEGDDFVYELGDDEDLDRLQNINRTEYEEKIYNRILRDKYFYLDMDDEDNVEKDFYEEFPEFEDVNVKMRNFTRFIKQFASRRNGVAPAPSRRTPPQFETKNFWHKCRWTEQQQFWFLITWARWDSRIECFMGFLDVFDRQEWRTVQKEKTKQAMMVDLVMSWLINARYKVRQAMKVRYLVKNDKRYLLGYLFNRLRRLIYDARKLFTANALTEESKLTRSLEKQVLTHREFLMLSVDVVDTIDHIKSVYLNYMEPRENKK